MLVQLFLAWCIPDELLASQIPLISVFTHKKMISHFALSSRGHQLLIFVFFIIAGMMPIAQAASSLPPDLEVLKTMVDQPDKSDHLKVWMDFAQTQRPIISKEDLTTIIKSQRSSMSSMSLSYESNLETLTSPGQKMMTRHSFMMSGNKLFYSSRSGPSINKLDPQTVIAYDGKALRTLQEQENGLSQGVIGKLESLKTFYRPDHLLASAMMLDSQRDMGMKWLPYDLVAILEQPNAIVLEQNEMVDGIKAVVAVDSKHRVYLDPDCNFAVLRAEIWTPAKDINGKTVFELTFVRNNKNLVNYGNGIWLPKQVETTWLKNGKPTNREVTKVLDATVNKVIGNDQFLKVFPFGSQIWDTFINLRYIIGEDNSIERLLDDDLESRSIPVRSSPPAEQSGLAKPSSATKLVSHNIPSVMPTSLGILGEETFIRLWYSKWIVGISFCLFGAMVSLFLEVRRRRTGGI